MPSKKAYNTHIEALIKNTQSLLEYAEVDSRVNKLVDFDLLNKSIEHLEKLKILIDTTLG